MIDASSLLIVAAGVLALPLTVFLLARYRREVGAAMRRSSGHPGSDSSPPGRPGPIAPDDARRGRVEGGIARNVAVVVAVGAMVGGAYAGLFLAWNGLGFRPALWAVLAVGFSWPAVVGVWIVCERDPWWGWGAPALYVAALWAAAVAAGGDHVDAAVLWIGFNLLPTVVVVAVLTRPFRAVGIVVLGVVMAGLAAAQTATATLAGRSTTIWPLAVLAAVSVGAAVVAAWVGSRWLIRWYQRRGFSDQMLLLGSLCFVFCVDYAVRVASTDPVALGWGLAIFLVVALAALAMYRLVDTGGSPVVLLVLRVFSPVSDPQRLLERVARRWRHIGPVRLIGAPDLALSTVEPDEFLAFAGGDLHRLFVHSFADLEPRLEGAPADPDGRHRIEEFFCFEDTWRPTVRRLLAGSDAVVMDLRGFGPTNRGATEELVLLARAGALTRTVVIADPSTDRRAVDGVLAAETAPTPVVVEATAEGAPEVVEALLATLPTRSAGR